MSEYSVDSYKTRPRKGKKITKKMKDQIPRVGPGSNVKLKKKSGDDTLTPGAKTIGKTIGKAWKGYIKSPTIIKEGVSKFVKQVKDTAYKEKTGVDMEGKRTGDKVKVKLKKKKK